MTEGDVPETTRPGDSLEREADRTAAVAPNLPGPRHDTSAGSTRLRTQSAPSHGLDFRSRGAPLSCEAKQQFQSYFGTDLSKVRLHDGSEANRLAKHLDADAVTYGSDIAFRQAAMYRQPELGSRLLAHELTHVIQGGNRIYRSVAGAIDAVNDGDTETARQEARGYFGAGIAKSLSQALSAVTAVSALLPPMSPALRGVAAAAAMQAQGASEAQELASKLDKLLESTSDPDKKASATYIVRRLEPSRMMSVPESMRTGGIPPRVYVPSNGAGAGNRTMSRHIKLNRSRGNLEANFAHGLGRYPTIDDNIEAFFAASFRRRINAAQASIPDTSKWLRMAAEDVMAETSWVLDAHDTTASAEQRAEARAVRAAAGRASFDAISQTLNVEESNFTSDEDKQIEDWKKSNSKQLQAILNDESVRNKQLEIAKRAGVRINRYAAFGNSFKCNIYMTDFADLHPSGPFLPKVWWTNPDKIKQYFAVDEISTKSPEVRYTSKAPPGINDWLRTVGQDYGWIPVPGRDAAAQEIEAQRLADAGEFVVFTAKTVGGGDRAGHSGVVAPRDQSKGISFDAGAAVGERFARSQAGAIGINQGQGGTNIFDSDHFDGGFWVYNPTKDKTAGKVPFFFNV